MGWFKKIFKGSKGNEHNHNADNDEPSADTYDEPSAYTNNDESSSNIGDEFSLDTDNEASADTDDDRSADTDDESSADTDAGSDEPHTQEPSTSEDEDEELARALQESTVVGNSQRHEYGNAYDNWNGHMYGEGKVYENGDSYYPRRVAYQMDYMICVGCNMEIGHGRYLYRLNALWHPDCFRCYECKHPISNYEVKPSSS